MATHEPTQWLYLNARGNLVITQNPVDGLKPLSNTRGFHLHAPADGVITADVEFYVGELDAEIPMERVRFVVRRRKSLRRLITRLWWVTRTWWAELSPPKEA